MTNFEISENLQELILAVARQQHRDPEELLELMLRQYEMATESSQIAPRPSMSLTDEDLEIPANTADPKAYRAAVRAMRPKLYRIARRYWLEQGDIERLALTDEELDKVFWLIDHEGRPRFKSEQGIYQPPPDPLEDLIGVIETQNTDLSMTVRESVAAHFRQKDGNFD